jgi:hypothetical protein
MSSPAPPPSFSEKPLLGATRLTSKTWPIAESIFPERLEMDDNQSLWVSQTPDYCPGAPLHWVRKSKQRRRRAGSDHHRTDIERIEQKATHWINGSGGGNVENTSE